MPSESIPADVRPGEVLAGKYRVERVLGVGGMGVVVAAHHIALDEKVALKFLVPEALRNPEAVARFVREARAAVKIKGEHVARVSDVGTLENGSPYMVMEFLEGGDMAEWLRQRGPLPIDQAVEFVLQACVAVADAHALGIVHRDLKPANLFCVRRSDGQLMIKVLDFGISKLIGPGASGPGMDMTKTSALMGTPFYMSPEQMRSSRDVDVGTDIWALGVILFEFIAGKPAFYAESVTELAIKVNNEPPPPLHTFRTDAPAGLEVVIRKCLEKKRGARYRNVGELAIALLPFAPKRARGSVERISGIIQASGLSASARAAAASPPADATQASAGTLPPFGRTTRGTKRGKKVALRVGLLGAIALVAGVTFVAVRWSKPPAPAPHQEPQPASSGPLLAPSALELATPGPVTTQIETHVEAGAASPNASASHAAHPPAYPAPHSAAHPPAAPPTPTPRCQLVSFFDSDGNEHFRQECK